MNEITRSPNFVFLVLRAGNFSKEAERETVCVRVDYCEKKRTCWTRCSPWRRRGEALLVCFFPSANSLS